MSKRARRRQRGREKAAQRVVAPPPFHMFAPSFYYYGQPREVWHMVHPLRLNRSVCTSVVNAVRIQRRLPQGAYYCAVCDARERFVEVLKTG